MGQEIECTMRYQKRSLAGKAYLETDYVLFRGDERVKVPFKDLTSVQASAGVLKLEWAGGPAELELGKAAEKWAGKILHPPARADKLGVKEGVAVRVRGPIEEDFLEELKATGVSVIEGREKVDIVFFGAEKAAELSKVAKLATGMKPGGAVWVIYPKGVKEIRETEVIEAGRAAGLKDVKVAGFSARCTALKFVRPVTTR